VVRKQQAYSATSGIDQEQRNQQQKQQHLDQENQWLRAGKCGNADLGQQTLGNDNSVTGFTDQSKNVQQKTVEPPTAAPTVSPTVSPTPTPTPTPTPGTLVVTKFCALYYVKPAFP
jgi:hypothetical protein